MAFFGELRVVGESVLDCPSDYLLGLNEPVGFGDDASVDAAGLVVGGCAVVFRRLGDYLYLLFCEPVAQLWHLPDDAAALEVVGLAVNREAEVVAGGSGVEDVLVHRIIGAEVEGP